MASDPNAANGAKFIFIVAAAGVCLIGAGVAIFKSRRGVQIPPIIPPIQVNFPVDRAPTKKLRLILPGPQTAEEAAELAFYKTITVRDPKYMILILRKLQDELKEAQEELNKAPEELNEAQEELDEAGGKAAGKKAVTADADKASGSAGAAEPDIAENMKIINNFLRRIENDKLTSAATSKKKKKTPS